MELMFCMPLETLVVVRNLFCTVELALELHPAQSVVLKLPCIGPWTILKMSAS